jgi:phage shock protein PspC (stress-responsive transcriptional regulator)
LKNKAIEKLARLVLSDVHPDGPVGPPRQRSKTMQATQGNLFTRDDTIFGVCQGLGDDLGFNPLWLRIAFAVLVYLNPVGAIAGYFGLGVIVLATRLLVPNPRRAVVAEPASQVAAEATEEQGQLALAA